MPSPQKAKNSTLWGLTTGCRCRVRSEYRYWGVFGLFRGLRSTCLEKIKNEGDVLSIVELEGGTMRIIAYASWRELVLKGQLYSQLHNSLGRSSMG